MSSIEKLSIRGIRSFSPSDAAYIEFQTPLTIILGHNGAGKTTIIECIKYATTGDLPPNSKGGAFIHDPKLARESDVKAQIKLKFKSVLQQQYIVTRSIQLSLKKTKIEQKTLESLLSSIDPKTGEQCSMSNRVSDLDSEVPALMGVSRAILDNVIFCHQEDSSWPLSEPGVLKKKFDEIFSATRYTKALDQFKSIRKDHLQQTKLEAQRLDFLKADLERSKRIANDRELAVEKVANCESKIAATDAQLSRVSQSLSVQNQKNVEFGKIRMDLERLLHEKKSLSECVEELSCTTSIMNESTDQLMLLADRHSNQSSSCEKVLHSLCQQKENVQNELTALQKDHAGKSTHLSFLQVEQESNSKKISQVCQQMAESATDLELKCSFDISFQNIDRFLNLVKEHISFKSSEIYDLKLKLRNIENNFFAEVQKSLSQQAELSESKRILSNRLSESKQKIIINKQKIDSFDISDLEFQKNVCNQEIVSLQKAISELNASLNTSKLKIMIAEKNLEISQKQNQLSEINNKISALSKYSYIQTEYDLKCSEIIKKSSAIVDAENEIVDSFVAMIASDEKMSFNQVETAVADNLLLLNESAENSRRLVEDLKLAEQKLSLSIAFEKSALSKKVICLKQIQESLNVVPSDKDLAQYLCELTAELKSLNYDSFKFFKDMIPSFEDTPFNCPSCPMCERSFSTAEERSVLLGKIRNFITENVDVISRKAELESRISEIEALRPSFEESKRLENSDIPQQTLKIASLEDEYTMLIQKIIDSEKKHSNDCQNIKKYADFLSKIDQSVTMRKELEKCQCEKFAIENNPLFADYKRLFEHSTPSMDSFCIASSRLQEEIQTISKEVDSLSNDYDVKMHEIRANDSRLAVLNDQLANIEQKIDLQFVLERETSNLEATVENILLELPLCEEKINQVSNAIEAYKAEKAEKVAAIGAAESILQTSVINLKSIYSSLENTRVNIKSRNYFEEISSLKESIQVIDHHIEEKQRIISQLNEKIGTESQTLSENALLNRKVSDNLKLRSSQQKLLSIQNQIDSQSKVVEEYDQLSVEQHISQLKRNESDLYGERNRYLGELHILKDQIRSFENDLNSEYFQITEKYQSQFVNVKTIELACNDLEKYSKALDSAIMKYHSLKMEEINKMIQELWTSTYQGSDIDTIEIRSDHDETTSTTRTYNYRVVMKKGEAELDMRGRSSAGQRVLTSLIIRLALAESFGVNCGVLALDEPTTNLDRANIESLADSLSTLIKNRRIQRNFQLIVITHDEEFVQLLGRSQYVDHYWRIGKNTENHSIIVRETI